VPRRADRSGPQQRREGLEYVRHVSGGHYEVVVRGDLDARQFIGFWLKDGRVKAA
jgi:3-phenylpropionate/trans-cinnamate dioxygenase ferredoxin reductase component